MHCCRRIECWLRFRSLVRILAGLILTLSSFIWFASEFWEEVSSVSSRLRSRIEYFWNAASGCLLLDFLVRHTVSQTSLFVNHCLRIRFSVCLCNNIVIEDTGSYGFWSCWLFNSRDRNTDLIEWVIVESLWFLSRLSCKIIEVSLKESRSTRLSLFHSSRRTWEHWWRWWQYFFLLWFRFRIIS